MAETIVLRALALLAGLLGCAVLARTVHVALHLSEMPGESALKVIARLSWGLVLLYLAWLAWRRPRGAPGRHRRRLLRALAVLAHEALQREYVESTPLTPLREALTEDWRRAHVPASPLFERAFDAAERAELAAFDADLRRLLAALPQTTSAVEDVKLLGTDRAWRALRERAQATFRRLGGALAR